MTPYDPMKEAAKQAAKTEMVKGVLWAAGAGVVSLVTYAMAEPGGGYVVFWGAAAYGAYRLLRGIYFWMNPNALLKKI